MKKLKLNQIEKSNLTNKEMNSLTGGIWLCTCSCYWAGTPGGASIQDNTTANTLIPGGGYSKEGGNQYKMLGDYVG